MLLPQGEKNVEEIDNSLNVLSPSAIGPEKGQGVEAQSVFNAEDDDVLFPPGRFGNGQVIRCIARLDGAEKASEPRPHQRETKLAQTRTAFALAQSPSD